jgi:phosphohistidine phosphatase SixA
VTTILLRHASAGRRAEWEGDDRLRPLDARGRRQAETLVPLLLAHGPTRVVSSPYVRCLQTVEPLAAALGVAVEHDERLAEGAAESAREVLCADGIVACTHGDVVEDLLGFTLRKGAACVLDGGRPTAAIPAP